MCHPIPLVLLASEFVSYLVMYSNWWWVLLSIRREGCLRVDVGHHTPYLELKSNNFFVFDDFS